MSQFCPGSQFGRCKPSFALISLRTCRLGLSCFRWSFGSNRIQVQAEIKLLGEVLAALQNDHIRGDYDITSLPGRNPAFAVPGEASWICSP
jgi:hypothetical protein